MMKNVTLKDEEMYHGIIENMETTSILLKFFFFCQTTAREPPTPIEEAINVFSWRQLLVNPILTVKKSFKGKTNWSKTKKATIIFISELYAYPLEKLCYHQNWCVVHRWYLGFSLFRPKRLWSKSFEGCLYYLVAKNKYFKIRWTAPLKHEKAQTIQQSIRNAPKKSRRYPNLV